MPGNSKSKRTSERKTKYTRSKKSKKTVDVVENYIETFENGCDVVSSILEENGKSDDKIDDEIASIASDTLLCLEEIYWDASSTQQSMSPITNWGSEISAMSLGIGEGGAAEMLHDKIHQKYQTASDHRTKEKVRRERIKDSCDQLRVLLPCIRGRKTDMASILEMCVDYVKLVNAALPQDFQNQIVEILAKDASIPDSPLPNEKSRKPDADFNTVSSTVYSDINNNEVGNANSGGLSSNNLPLKDNSDPLVSSKQTKRFGIQADAFLAAPSSCMTSGISVAPFEDTKAPKPDMTGIDQQQSSYNFSGGHHPLYNEFDIQNFSILDTSSNTYYGSPLATNKNMHDRDNFGLYLDPQSFYQFYGSNTMCSHGIGPVPDYLNQMPSFLLPTTSVNKLM